MFEEQKGRCSICGKHQSEFENRLCVEHNHKTDKVRGLVCKVCNHLIDIYETDFYGQGDAIMFYLETQNG